MTNFRLPYIGAEAVILGMTAFNANSKTVQQQLGQIGRSAYMLERTSRGSFAGLEASAVGAFTAVGNAALAVAGVLLSTATAAALVGMQYQQHLGNLGAIAQATSEQVHNLSMTQLELSRHTTTSAVSLNKASAEMVKAGFDIADVNAKTLTAVNNLVILSEGELTAGNAAIAARVGVANFGATVDQVMNAAAATTLKSTLGFTGYADAIRQAGPTVASFGVTIDEFGALVALASQRIASGTEVGTGLRMMFSRLQKPTQEAGETMRRYGISLYDAAGAARPVRDILSDLSNRFSDAAVKAGKITQVERDRALATLFTARSGRVALAVINEGVDAYDDMLDAIKHLEAQEIASQFMAQTASKAQIAANAITALGIAFGQGLDPYINDVLTSMLTWLQSIDLNKVFAFGQAVGGAVYVALANLGDLLQTVILPTMGDVFNAWGLMLEVISGSPASIDMASSAMGVLGATLKAALVYFVLVAEGGALLVTAASQGAAAVLKYANDSYKSIVLIGNALIKFASGVVTTMYEVAQTVGDVLGWLVDNLDRFGEITSVRLRATLTDLADGVDVYNNILAVLASNSLEILGLLVDSTDDAFRQIYKGLPSWAQFWQNLVLNVGRAVMTVLKWIDNLLEGMQSLTPLGITIGSARVAVKAIEGMIPVIGSAATGVGKFASTGASALRNFNKAVAFTSQDFKSKLDAMNKAATDSRDKLLQELARKPKPMMDEGDETVPGSFPVDEGAAKKQASLADRIGEIWNDFSDALAKEQRTLTKDIAKLYDDTGEAMSKAMKKANAEIAKNMQDAYVKIIEMAQQRLIDADAKNRRDALNKQLADEAKARDLRIDAEEEAHKRELEDNAVFERMKREQREKEFDDYLQTLALQRKRDREDEDHVFKQSQEARQAKLEHDQDADEASLEKRLDGRERELKAEQDMQERALKATLDAKEEALNKELDLLRDNLDKQQDAEKRALEKSQDAREAALDQRLDTEARARDDARDLAEVSKKEAADIAEVEAKFQSDIARGVKRSIAEKARTEGMAEIAKGSGADKTRLLERQKQAQEDAVYEQSQDAQRLALRAKFEQEDLALEAAHDAATAALEAAAETRRQTLKAQSDAALLTQQQAFEQATYDLKAENERKISDLKAEHERERDRLADKIEYEALLRSRAREDEDAKYADAQAARKANFQRMEDDKLRVDQRKIEDSERERRRGLEVADATFHDMQEREKARLEEQLDNESYQRKIEQIGLESVQARLTTEKTLAEEQEMLRDKLADDLLQIKGNMDDRIATVQSQYLDKLQDILKESNNALKAPVDEMTGRINGALEDIRDTARETVEALAEVFGAAANLQNAQLAKLAGPTVGNKVAGASMFTDEPADGARSGSYTYSRALHTWVYMPESSYGDYPSDGTGDNGYARYQYGGTVPGPFGMPVMVQAHGGERFQGVGAYSLALAAVKAAESAWSSGMGASTVIYDTDYNVSASYGKTQDQGSISRDLSALAILTRK